MTKSINIINGTHKMNKPDKNSIVLRVNSFKFARSKMPLKRYAAPNNPTVAIIHIAARNTVKGLQDFISDMRLTNAVK